MSWLYVDDFSQLGIDAHGQPVIAPDYAFLVTLYRRAIAGDSPPGPAFYGTRFIQVHTEATCTIAIAASPWGG